MTTLTYTRYLRNLIITGGFRFSGHDQYYDDILEFEPKDDIIKSLGQMTKARSWHAVSVVKVQDYRQWCQ